ncbi:MAG: addiction module antitoxin [Alteromonadaceae bacterium]|nr:MAG: addiction module antitoxin [Alteromonadaceae bacterium]
MSLNYTPEFKRALRKLSRRYRSLRGDLTPLLIELEAGKTPGDQLQSGGRYTAFKVRVKNSDSLKGKSGGYRVIYYLKSSDQTVLTTLYSKSEQSDIPVEELRRIIEKYEGSGS